MNLKRPELITAIVLFLIFLISFPVEAGDKGKLYVVGMGPAGPDLTAPRALEIIKKADVYLCSPGMPDRFEKFGA